MKFSQVFLLSFSILLGLGCAQGNCRSQESYARSQENQASAKTIESAMAPMTKTKVYKYDGSLQCGKGVAIAPATMAKDLGDIKILSMESKADGLMHIQSCGSVTGKANVFEIDTADLAKAKSKGFKEWTFE